jgi:hypothetical protein
MLSRDYRTIFVHIPKTGGQSVETVFLKVHGLTWEERGPLLLRANTDPSKGPPRLAHLFANEYVACGHVSPEEFDAFFKFAVVRNPWARAVSAYKYMVSSNGVPFGVFVRRTIMRGGRQLAVRQIEPQTRYVCGADGALLVDRLIRFENLTAEFAEVSRQIFGREEPLPTVNVSSDRRDYRSFYDDATADIVANVYARDIAMFGYAFDPRP